MTNMKSFKDYLSEAEQVSEKSVSKSQQQAAGIALAAKRGDMPKSKLKGASKEMSKMSTKDLEDFAKTKHKDLPKKVDEDGPDKADIPAYKRKEKGGNWKVNQKDLDDKEASTMTTHAGLKKREKEMRGVAEGSLNEFAQGDFNGSNGNNDLQLYLNVAKKLNMKKYKPSTAHDLIAKKMAKLVDDVDDDKVDWARHMARKAQGLPSMVDQQGVAEAMRRTDDPFDDMIEDYLDYLESVGQIRKSREEEKAQLISDLEAGYVHPSEIEYALSGTQWDPLGEQGVAEGGLTEGVLTDSVGDTMAHIMQTFGPEVKKFVATDELDDDLYNALYDYYFDDMPYGIKKARTGDPYEWVADRFYDELKDQGMVEETVEAPVDNTELDDLARLAGLR
jgi:hypothetical protein